MRIPEYITIKDFRFSKDAFDERVLPAGSFVKPIDPRWLPEHVKQTVGYRFFNPDTEVFVYCKYGIIELYKNILRQV